MGVATFIKQIPQRASALLAMWRKRQMLMSEVLTVSVNTFEKNQRLCFTQRKHLTLC